MKDSLAFGKLRNGAKTKTGPLDRVTLITCRELDLNNPIGLEQGSSARTPKTWCSAAKQLTTL